MFTLLIQWKQVERNRDLLKLSHRWLLRTTEFDVVHLASVRWREQSVRQRAGEVMRSVSVSISWSIGVHRMPWNSPLCPSAAIPFGSGGDKKCEETNSVVLNLFPADFGVCTCAYWYRKVLTDVFYIFHGALSFVLKIMFTNPLSKNPGAAACHSITADMASASVIVVLIKILSAWRFSLHTVNFSLPYLLCIYRQVHAVDTKFLAHT